MAEKYNPSGDRNFFGVGIYHGKTYQNLGSLLRTAYMYGASYAFTIGARYSEQRTDVGKVSRHCPVFNYKDFDDFYSHIPQNSDLVAVEMGERAKPMELFTWPPRPIILLGAEDIGIPETELKKCRFIVNISTKKPISINVACAGSMAIYDYHAKRARTF